MKKTLLISIFSLFTFLISNVSVAQINTGSPAVPFGSNTQYEYGIVPTNASQQDAIDAYNAWKTNYVESCSGDRYRVLFGPDENYNTVSEGIAYGMILSVYASDKTLFDGLWAYYKQFKNGNGVMDWKISGCDGGVVSTGAATDAELDAAMALIIAAEQWADNTYTNDARVLIQAIKNTEMASDGQTLNGDQWGNTNTCRNPSYQAPAYYTEFAKVDTDNASFWSTTAVNAASTLLLANRNSTSGLVSNWSDNNGTENECGNTGSGAYGYGADACRNPWRMATDFLWHGSNACAAADDINAKLVNFVNGYENQLKGPISDRSVSNPSSGSYVNGSYTTYALAVMTDASAQTSLNKCYTAVASLSDVDQYFNSTVRCLTMFMMTGNFWAPGASGFVFPPIITNAETNGTGTEIYLTSNQDLSSTSATASTFTLYLNGTAQSGAITNVSISGTTITLNVASASSPQPGQSITLSYNGSGNILSTEGEALEAFDQMDVLNLLEGNETILDDCDDGNELNNVGGIWFTFNDTKDQDAACTPGTKSSISPLTGKENPFQMTAPGYNSDYAVNASYTLGANYTPYDGGSCASWENPSYVGIGTWVDDEEDNSMDWSSGVGVSFWYKGPVSAFQVIIEEVTDFCFHKVDIPECTEWTQITVLWNELAQPTWGAAVEFSAQNVLKLQWQFETGNSGAENSTGEFWIDDVRIMNMPPVALTSMTIDLVPDADLIADDSNPNADPTDLPIGSGANGDTLFLQITPTPADASYPVVFWSSSDETVATVDYLGRVIGVGYGEATITARSKMHQNVTATYTVTIQAPSVEPESITFNPTSYTLEVGGTNLLIPTFYSSQGGVTETGLTWTTSNSSVVSVNSGGTITANSIGGPVTITATSTANTSVSATVQVTVVKTDVTDLTVDPTSLDLNLGDNATITATIEPTNATNKMVIWTTSDNAVVTVTDGVVSSVGAGNATITATSADNASVFVDIPVTVSGNFVTDITLTPATTSVVTGADVTLTAEVLPAAASDKTVSWSSSNTDIATVNTGGVVTGVAVGTVTITATANDESGTTGTASIEVTPILVSDITISPASATVITTETEQFTVSVLPSGAADKTVTWSSDNTSVATVDAATGLVTAVSPGLAAITATANDGGVISGTAQITVANQAVTEITISPASQTIVINEILQLSKSVAPTNATDKTVTWSSDNTDVATVNTATGLVTGVSVGTVTIIATANDGSGITGTATIFVDPILVSEITISPATATVITTETQQLTESVLPSGATDKTVTWSSDNTDVATVDAATGLVTAVSPGPAAITATANDGSGITGTAQITVANQAVTGITISPASQAILINETLQLSKSVAPTNATDKTVTWSSDNTDVATVNTATGLVTGVSVGTVTITATANDGSGITETATIVVDPILISEITISPASNSVNVGSTITLTESVVPTYATDKTVTWSSANTAVATVNPTTGVVTGVADGIVSIIATANDVSGITGTAEITVTEVLPTSVVTAESLGFVDGDAAKTLTATVSPSNTTDKTVTWSSDDATVATVDALTGDVTPQGVGSCYIFVTCNADATVIDSCLVTVDASVTLVTGVTVSPQTAEIVINEELTLSAAVEPIDATDKSVSWLSLDETIATVSNGILTGANLGSTQIIVTTNDGVFTDTCNVTVATLDVTDIILSNNGTDLLSGEEITLNTSSASYTLLAEVQPSNATDKTVSWSSDNTAAVTVTNGVLSAVGVGTAIITATANDGSGITETVSVIVEAIPVVGVALDQTTLSLSATSSAVTLQATIDPLDATNQTVTWESNDTDVVTVTNGVVEVVGVGNATITVITEDGGHQATCTVEVSANQVTDIILSNNGTDLLSGEEITLNTSSASYTLLAEVQPTDASDKTVSWSSDNTAAVTVTNGVLSAVGVGTAIITATANDGSGITETVSVIVEAIPVVGVALDQTTLSLSATSSAVTLQATIDPLDATNQTVTWESDDTDVVTVTNGVVEVVGVGNATITVITEDGGHQATCTVEVSANQVTDIILSNNGTDLLSGEEITLNTSSASYTLSAEVQPTDASDKTVLWSSDNTAAVIVTNGVLSVIGVGTAIITATANDGSGVTETVSVTVEPVAVTGITTNVSELSLTVGGSNGVIAETVLPEDATNQDVVWESDNNTIASVVDGVVTPEAQGTTVITVTTVDGGYAATVDVLVSINSISVTGVSLNIHSDEIQLNETLDITATISPSNATNKNITWESLNPALAEVVPGTGKVTVNPLAVSEPDSVGIVVISEDGTFTDTCYVTIIPIIATSLSIDNSITLDIEASGQILATVNPEGASTVLSWSSADEAVATVDSQGNVTPVSEGTTVITATTTDGSNITSNDCSVTITVVHVESVSVSPTSLILEVGGSTEQLTATISPVETYNKNVSWTSNMPSVVSVSATGVVTPLAAGNATITATSLDNSTKKATCIIEVVDKSTLVSAISDAQLIHDNAVEGTALGDYKPGAKAEFQLAIDAAQAVVNNASSTQAVVDQAILDLEAAEVEFNKQKVVDETLIFNAELENLTYMNTYWFSYSDNEPGGSSTVVPLSTETDPFTMSSPGADGTGSAAMIDYSLMGQVELGYPPFVGMGMPLNADETPYDLSGSTGIQFAYKSNNAFILEINLSAITDDANYYYDIPASDEWTVLNLTWADFTQYDWPDAVVVPWDLTDVVKFQWKVQDADGTEGQIWVDDVKIKGTVLDLPELNIVDKSILESTISSAEALQTAAVPGDAAGEYPQSAISDLGTAVAVAQTVYDNAEATQDEIDVAVTNLNTAITTFEASVIVIDKSVLESTITSAQTLAANAEAGAENGQYPQSAIDDLEAAITTAQSVFTDVTVSQADVNTAVTNLNTAIAGFEAQEVVVNTQILDALIVTAQDFHDNSVEGPADGEYPSGSKETLQLAINYATSIATNPASTQADVDQAESDLDAALTTFQESVIGVNKGTLFTKIATATTLHNNSVEGLNMGEYPEGAKADLMTAITTAQSVYDDSQASQDDVNLAVINLQAAVDLFEALEITVDRAVLYSTMSEALALNNGAVEGEENGQYPIGSKANLMTAINAAQTVYNNASSTQAQINQAIADLNSAIDTFEALQIYIEPLDKSLLSATIDVAKSKLDLAVDNTGDQPGNYPLSAVNALLAGISHAQNVMQNAETQEELNSEVIVLESAIAVFIASEVPVPIDKSVLDSLIAEGDTLLQTAQTGTESGQYPQTDYISFYSDLQSARILSRDALATQEEVDAKVIVLELALQAFRDSQISVSIDEVSIDVSVYPNPCVSYVYVKASSEITTVTVVSLLGETVVDQTVNSSEVTLDMNKASSGMYLINIMYTNGASQTVKVTKK